MCLRTNGQTHSCSSIYRRNKTRIQSCCPPLLFNLISFGRLLWVRLEILKLFSSIMLDQVPCCHLAVVDSYTWHAKRSIKFDFVPYETHQHVSRYWALVGHMHVLNVGIQILQSCPETLSSVHFCFSFPSILLLISSQLRIFPTMSTIFLLLYAQSWFNWLLIPYSPIFLPSYSTTGR